MNEGSFPLGILAIEELAVAIGEHASTADTRASYSIVALPRDDRAVIAERRFSGTQRRADAKGSRDRAR